MKQFLKTCKYLAKGMRDRDWQGGVLATAEHDGKKLIVDGHHRISVAKRTGTDSPCRETGLPHKGHADLEGMLRSWPPAGPDRFR